jgi:hypothetical protein
MKAPFRLSNDGKDDIEQCTIDNNTFDSIEPQECTIYIPQGEIAAYRKHPALGKFKIVEKLIN